MKDFIINLLSKNTELSCTRFVYFLVNIIAAILVLSCSFAIVYESIKTGKIAIDYFTGIAQVILASAVLVLIVGTAKALSDKPNTNKNLKYGNEKNENPDDLQ